MADTIERLIYKLELDSSGYVAGLESLANSTKKLTAEQERTNAELKKNETALKNSSTSLAARKKALDDFTATQAKSSATIKAANEKYEAQLNKSYQLALTNNQKLTSVVAENRKAYEAATKAAQDFANTSARANNLQAGTTGGKIGPQPGITSGITSQIAGVLNVADFTKQAQIIEQTKDEFDDLAVSIGLAEARMNQLNEADEEFQQLAPIVAKGKEALQQYDNATKTTVQSTGSLRTRLREGREELVKLEQAGKGATKQYFDLEKSVAKLTDEFGDQQARIKILASDTKLLDFGKGAITAATSAFQVYTAVSILAGDESEELQKKTMQLFAAMQLLQSLEQLSNLTRREGILATLGGSAAQSVYTAVVGASTGALKAFKIALATTGIGAAIVLIGFLVSKWIDLKEAQEKAAVSQKALLEIQTKAVDSYAEEVVHLKLLSSEYENVNTSAKRKKDIQDELQKSYPSYFADLDKHADKEKYIAEQIDKVSKAIVLKAKIQAAEGLLADKFQEVLKKQFDPSAAVDFGDKLLSSLTNFTDKAAKADLAKTAKKNVEAAEKEYDAFATFITGFVTKSNAELETLGGDPSAQIEKEKTKKEIKAIQNDYEQKKAEFAARLAALKAKEAIDEQAIKDQFGAALRREKLEIDKNKNLTKDQKVDLKKDLGIISGVELSKALDDFHKKQKDARQKLYDELNTLQDKNAEDSLNLLQNEFDRRAKLIQLNEEKDIVDTIEANQRRLEAFEESSKLIYGKDYETNKSFLARKALLVAAGEQEITNITLKAAQDRANLSADIFQELLSSYDKAIDDADLIRDEDQAKQLTELKRQLLAQEITFKQFQDRVKKIKDTHDRDMKEGDLVVLKDQLAELDRKIASTEDKTTKHYKKLLEQQKKFRKDIAAKETEAATDTGDDPDKDKMNRVLAYVEASAALADSVVGFWKAANDAEAAALDRSISLQEKRVSAAQKIAERGNAQYLKAEDDRLRELNLKRENAARKQLGIDAALQASQLLVGITGAISKIATPGIGIAETIGAIAIIVGALATGYGLVKSLQGNQPSFFVGTKDTGMGGAKDNKGGFAATLHPNEAVIPADRNKAYKPAIAAIYDKTIPAEHLNQFVNTYHKIKAVALPDYGRIKEAAELKISGDGKMVVAISEQNKLIMENNDLQKQTLRALKSMGVNVNMDKNGFAMSIMEVAEQIKINSRV